jgi:hypothetical protein
MRLSLSLILFALAVVAIPSVAADADAADWSVDQVSGWASKLTLQEESAAKFKDGITANSIDGTILMHVSEDDLKDDMGISSSLQRKVIIAAITKLKGGARDGNRKMNFWQYRSLHRKEMDHLMTLLNAGAPRWGITKFAELPEYGRPEKPLGGGHNAAMAWFEWLVIPEYYIYLNSDTIAGGLPGLMSFMAAMKLIISALTLFGHALARNPGGVVQHCFTQLGTEVVVGCGAWLYMNTLWRILPWFICDWIFYFAIYVAPVIGICVAIVGLLAVGAALGIASRG